MKNHFENSNAKPHGAAFWRRPVFGRRLFFRHAATALGGYFLLPRRPGETVARAAVTPLNVADNCIFILMSGAPSHTDTFDLKEGAWLPASYNPTRYNDVLFPQGLFPKLAEQLGSVALLRSMRAWVPVHGVSQVWTQIGRNPLSAMGKIAPHVGSIVSMELSPRNTTQILPTFLSLNTGSGPGEGYFPPQHGPFYVSPGGGGLPNTTHRPDGRDNQERFNTRYGLLETMDAELRSTDALGSAPAQVASYSAAARTLMYNTSVNQIFTFDAAERARYGTTSFGNACITARNLLRAKLGTRFIQITVGGWDNHSNIYTGALNAASATSLAHQFDNALGTLLADLAADGLLSRTLVVAFGEFGRTVGALNATSGRDHHVQQAALIAGAGIRGLKAIGATDAQGRNTAEPGWKAARDIRDEDIEATIYSALGIDWTITRHDDPLGRGFDYVPFANQGEYEPVHELWS